MFAEVDLTAYTYHFCGPVALRFHFAILHQIS